jgi:hypothetical protein
MDVASVSKEGVLSETKAYLRQSITWLFAAVYDSGKSRGSNNRNPPGPEDKGRPEDKDLNGGVYFLYPTQSQAEYVFDMLQNLSKNISQFSWSRIC